MIMMMASAVDVAKGVPNRIHRCPVIGKFVAEVAVYIDEKRSGLEGQQSVGVDGHDEDADVGDA